MIANNLPLSGFILTVKNYMLHPKENGVVLLAGCFPNSIDQIIIQWELQEDTYINAL